MTVTTRIQPQRAARALIRSILVRDRLAAVWSGRLCVTAGCDRRVHDGGRAIRLCVRCGDPRRLQLKGRASWRAVPRAELDATADKELMFRRPDSDPRATADRRLQIDRRREMEP